MHQGNPVQYVNHEQLADLGVLYFNMPELDKDPKLDALRKERGYTNFDYVNLTKETPMQKLVEFFQEHIHEDEEIRLCIEGSGFFDVRSMKKDKWIRIHCRPGDLLIIPAGLYHRFTLDENRYIRAMRLFTSAPKWIPIYRTDIEKEQAGKPAPTGAGTPIILNEGPRSLANYPHARVFNGLVYLSGFSSRREDNTHRGATWNEETKSWDLDIAEQTRGVIQNMRNALRAAGSDLNHLIDITVFLIDMQYYKGFNEVYDEYFTANEGPTRTTVAVKQLPHPNLLIEIKGVAALPQPASAKPESE